MKENEIQIRFFINGEEKMVRPGDRVSGLLDSSHGVDMPCGGRHACGKCMVYAEGDFQEPSETEIELFGKERLEHGIRLACFLETVPDGKIWSLHQKQDGDETICLNAETAAQETSRRLYSRLGAAVDIGTTTIAVSLHRDGIPAGSIGAWNPQAALGADVVSRIEASLEGQAQRLAKLVQSEISRLLDCAAARAGERAEEIETVVITGNTAMLYFLTGKNP